MEVSSGLVILWQFRHPMPESRERRAQRLIALSFFALAGYLLVDAGHALLTGAELDGSPVGIALAPASLAIMPFLSLWQRRTGREPGSAAVEGDGTQTPLCTYLSAVLLAGLVLNATLGWSWADPGQAALVIAVVAAREGWQTWNGDVDCCPPTGLIGAATAGEVTRQLRRRMLLLRRTSTNLAELPLDVRNSAVDPVRRRPARVCSIELPSTAATTSSYAVSAHECRCAQLPVVA